MKCLFDVNSMDKLDLRVEMVMVPVSQTLTGCVLATATNHQLLWNHTKAWANKEMGSCSPFLEAALTL